MNFHGTLVGIVGPTASGKTSVGIELAVMIGGEIVSADSMAVYLGMDIGTAKPSREEQDRVRFHLIDVFPPEVEFSVAEFKRLAEEAIDDISGRGKAPILVGGTGLYVKALTGGLNIPVAEPDRDFRERLKAEAAEFGNERLLERLRLVDVATAERLHPNDLGRIIRALEVHALTGTPISKLHETAGRSSIGYEVRLFGLSMSRATLYERIERRIDEQMAAGLIEEVAELIRRGCDERLPSMKALGYKQIAGYLRGEYDLQTCVDMFKRDTRRFAKRQLTWFRAEPDICWIDVEGRDSADVAAEISGMLPHKTPMSGEGRDL
jgi:tRNA dimethylallyltransferase